MCTFSAKRAASLAALHSIHSIFLHLSGTVALFLSNEVRFKLSKYISTLIPMYLLISMLLY
nr:MAG TPA: hypothetical protein [Caudoviricetes sp.]